MKRTLTCLLLMAALAGCSGMKTYRNTAENNLLIRTKASGSLFMSVDVSLDLYKLKGHCERDYLGTVKLKNGETRIGIAIGEPVYLAFFFDHRGGSTAYSTILTPRPGIQYISDVRYVDRIYDVSVHEATLQGGMGREIERQTGDCPEPDQVF